MGTKGNDFESPRRLVADYFDPYDFINVLFDGTKIQDANNNNYTYFNNAKYNAAMKAASKLSGQARYKAYGKLDVDIMTNAAPWAPVFNYTSRDFISPNTENFYLTSPCTVTRSSTPSRSRSSERGMPRRGRDGPRPVPPPSSFPPSPSRYTLQPRWPATSSDAFSGRSSCSWR